MDTENNIAVFPFGQPTYMQLEARIRLRFKLWELTGDSRCVVCPVAPFACR